MINTTLLSARNILVIAVFAVVAQIVFAKVHQYLGSRDKTPSGQPA